MKTAIHACRFLLGLDLPESQVTRSELDCLLTHVTDAKVVVEIGCYEGRTTSALAMQTKGSIFAIDPFTKGRIGVRYGEIIAKTHCRRLGLENVNFLKGLSYEVAPSFNWPIDFLFIDADHEYEALKRDWEDWFPKVREGGVIALHDCRQAPNSPVYLGSMKFYESDLPSVVGVEEIAAVDSLVVLRVGKWATSISQ